MQVAKVESLKNNGKMGGEIGKFEKSAEKLENLLNLLAKQIAKWKI